MKELNDRLSELLDQSVEDYIKTAVPISSGAIAVKAKLARSPATVRGDLKTLEAMGYLKQVHTSGGRIPTTQGYRAYVNRVMQGLNIKPGELSFAAEQISERTTSLPGLIDDVCKKLESVINYPIIVRSQFDHLIVEDVKVIPLVGSGTMVLIKTSAGALNQTIETENLLTERESEDAAAALSSTCVGMTLRAMLENLSTVGKKAKSNLRAFDGLCKKLSEKLEQVIEKNLSRSMNLIKLLDIPDYANIERVKKLGKAIENDETLARVMNADNSVVIGTELGGEGLDDSSVIKFDYKIGGERIASVGILGPERMDYKNLIAALYSLLATTVESRKLSSNEKLRIKN